MSHSTSMKRRLGAAITSFVTAAALVVPLAGPALADDGPTSTDPSVDLLNPDETIHQLSTYAPIAYISVEDDGTYHLAASVAKDTGGQAITQVAFRYDCASPPTESTTDGTVIGIDTVAPYGVQWAVPASLDGKTCQISATVTDTGGQSDSDSTLANINLDAPAAEITYPTHGGTLGVYTPVGTTSQIFTIRGVASANTAMVFGTYSRTPAGSDVTDYEANAADCEQVEPEDDGSFVIVCDAGAGSAITSVGVGAADDSDNPTAASSDAHAVTVSPVNPELLAVTVSPTSDTAAAGVVCNEYTVTVKDVNGNPVAGVNVDVRAEGPDDSLSFAITDDTSDFRAPDGFHATLANFTEYETAADCDVVGEGDVFENGDTASGATTDDASAGDSGAQGVIVDDETVIDADTNDTKAIEGESDGDGQFIFAIFSPTAGSTSLNIWADTADEDDINDDPADPNPGNRERDTTASKTWYAPVVTSLQVDPGVGFNNLRTSHHMVATLLDQNGNPVPDKSVNFDITAGPNATDPDPNDEFDGAPCNTDGLGMCEVIYTDTLASSANGFTDTILAWVNSGDARDTTGGANPDEPQDTVTKTWVDVEDACLDATPEYGLNANDEVHTILVTVRESDGVADGVCTGEPIANASVNALIVDDFPNAALSPDVNDGGAPGGGDEDFEQGLTDANGQVSFDLFLVTDGIGDWWNTVEFRFDGDTNFYGCCSSGPSYEVDSDDWCESCTDSSNYDVQNENGFDSVDKEWGIPGEPRHISLAPRYDTNELGTSHTVVATVTDAFGDPVANEDVTISVNSGPNAGATVTCTTNAAGQCSFTYTDSEAVDADEDEILAFVVSNSDIQATAYKLWLEDAEADAIGLDMETASRGDGAWDCCSGEDSWPTLGTQFGVNDTNPDTADDWDPAAVPNQVGDVHRIVASAKSGTAATGDVLKGHEMDFSLSGVGEFVEWDEDADDWISLGTSVSTPIMANGGRYAVVYIRSTEVGTSTVTTSIDDVEATGTKDWYAGPARNIAFLPPTTKRALPGTIAEHTAHATDRFGNDVPGWSVCFSEQGPGTIRTVQDQFNENCWWTDEDGLITIEVETNASESGTQTITADLDGMFFLAADHADGGPECEAHEGEDRFGNEQGAPSPEGNCQAEATVIWSTIGNPAQIDPLEPTSQTVTSGQPTCLPTQVKDANGNNVPDAQTYAVVNGANDGAEVTGATGPCSSGTAAAAHGALTDSNGVSSFSYTPANTGTDTITVWADLDGSGGTAPTSGDPTTTYTLTVEGPDTTDTGDTNRLAGANRIATALAISQDSFAADAAGAVVLARSDDFPDALAGTPLAVAKNAPMLLTESSLQSPTLNSQTRAEIDRVLPSGATVYILGGTVAVPAGAETELRNAGYNVIRLGGADRYATAILIADAVSSNPTSILITTGANFPDALAAGSAAVQADGVIVLSRGAEKVADTDAYLARAVNADATLYAIGGPSVTAYGSLTPAANELAGASRLSTAIAVAQKFFSNPTDVGIATMRNFPDALTGGAHIARLGGPLVLINGENLSLGFGSSDPGVVQNYLEANANSLDLAHIYGGTAVISNFAQLQVRNAIDASS